MYLNIYPVGITQRTVLFAITLNNVYLSDCPKVKTAEII